MYKKKKQDLALNIPQGFICYETKWPKEMDMMSRVQILNKANCISFYANALGKDMNPSFLLPIMGKL